MEVSGSADGVNWVVLPVRPVTGGVYLAAVAGAAPGVWVAACAGFARLRARVTAYMSGSATAVLLAATGLLDDRLLGEVSSNIGTATGVAGVAVTLTLAAPGAGLRHHLTRLAIERDAATALTAGATPTLITTTNLPGSLAFSIPVEAAVAGNVYEKIIDPARPIMSSAQNTATTIVAGVTSEISRITELFYVAP